MVFITSIAITIGHAYIFEDNGDEVLLFFSCVQSNVCFGPHCSVCVELAN